MSHRRRGFTLFELIIALGMMSAVSLSLYLSMSTAFKARKSVLAAVKPIRQATIAADLICHDFESLVPVGTTLAPEFIGDRTGVGASNVEFYALGRDAVDEPGPLSEGIRRIELVVDATARPPVLVRRVTRNLLALSESQPEDEIICEGVRTFTLAYYDGTAWQETWDPTLSSSPLPLAIQMVLELEPPADAGDGAMPTRIVRYIPVAVAKPATSASGGTP